MRLAIRLVRWILTDPDWPRCRWHDHAWPLKIAELEVALGIDPLAVQRMRANVLVENFCDPDIVDCGKTRCRRNRRMTP